MEILIHIEMANDGNARRWRWLWHLWSC